MALAASEVEAGGRDKRRLKLAASSGCHRRPALKDWPTNPAGKPDESGFSAEDP